MVDARPALGLTRLRLEESPEQGLDQLVLARAERGNAIDLVCAEELDRAVARVHDNVRAGRTRVLLMTAEGPMFCVGGDLEDFPSDGDVVVSHLSRMAAMTHRALATIVELPIPVVIAVQGTAAGAGIGLVACGDIVIASRSARFRSAYTAVGLSPDCGTSWLLPRVMGERRAMDMVLTNRVVSADQAEAWGLVSRAVDADSLDAEVDDVVAALLATSAPALADSKRLLRASAGNHLVAHLADEAATISARSADPEARRAREGFLARTAPPHC